MLSKICILSAASAASVQALKVKAGKCPFGFTSGDKPSYLQVSDNVQFPSDVLTCSSNKVIKTPAFTKGEYEKLASEIIAHQEKSENPTRYAACLLRLEGHDLMDYRTQDKRNSKGKIIKGQPKVYGGADGCVNFHDGDNAGLPTCLAWTGINSIYGEWCDKISLADFMVLAAEAVVGAIASTKNDVDPFGKGTLLKEFRDQFEFGRETLETCPENEGFMPNPENGCDDLQKVFIDHVFNGKFGKGKSWRYTAALSGAHTIGFAKPENSGYDGAWGDPENSKIFNNNYFRNIVAHGWTAKNAVGGNTGKNQWQLADRSPDAQKKGQMMLNTDMCMFYQDNKDHAKCMAKTIDGKKRNIKKCRKWQKKGKFLNAVEDGKPNQCCTWMRSSALIVRGIIGEDLAKERFCGLSEDQFDQTQKDLKEFNKGKKCKDKQSLGDFIREDCCGGESADSWGDCDQFIWPKGPAINIILGFAKDEQDFYKAYLEAWKHATGNGWKLTPLE